MLSNTPHGNILRRESSLEYLQNRLEKTIRDYYVRIYSLAMEVCFMVHTLIFYSVCVCGYCLGPLVFRMG